MKSAERSRMDAAHELGHLVLHWRGDLQVRDAEQEADAFGSAFLMPGGSIRAEAPRGARLEQLIEAKRRWKVAVANLAYRMRTVGLLTDWQYRALFVEITRRGYRTAEPDGIDRETSQVLDKVFRGLRQEGMTKRELARTLAIPVAELNKIVFGLVMTPMEGEGRADPTSERPDLRSV
jgi:Zn-dependent peptidase ImmA (M78 family)